MRILVAGSLGMAIWTSVAFGDECGKAITQYELNQCATQAFQRSDDALNKAYTQIIDRLKQDSAKIEVLRTAEIAWTDFRDAECAFVSSETVDGSAHSMVFAQCRETLTRARVAMLEGYLNCQEGDLTCPVPRQ